MKVTASGGRVQLATGKGSAVKMSPAAAIALGQALIAAGSQARGAAEAVEQNGADVDDTEVTG